MYAIKAKAEGKSLNALVNEISLNDKLVAEGQFSISEGEKLHG
jgi:hypothetical protein